MNNTVELEPLHQYLITASEILAPINGEIKCDLSQWPQFVATVSDADTTYTLTMQAKEPDEEPNLIYGMEMLMQRILDRKKTATGRDLEELERAEQLLDDAICSVNSIE